MLNQTGVTKVTATTPKGILAVPEQAIAFPCIVNNTGISAGTDGKKIIKAGTPVTGNLEARGTEFTKATTSDGASNAVGVLAHDVDVTAGNANASVLVFGVVNMNAVDASVTISKEERTALNKIIFIK